MIQHQSPRIHEALLSFFDFDTICRRHLDVVQRHGERPGVALVVEPHTAHLPSNKRGSSNMDACHAFLKSQLYVPPCCEYTFFHLSLLVVRSSTYGVCVSCSGACCSCNLLFCWSRARFLHAWAPREDPTSKASALFLLRSSVSE